MILLANNGRTVLAEVESAVAAKRWLLDNFGETSLYMVKHMGWKLNVWERPEEIVEVNGGLRGLMYSIER